MQPWVSILHERKHRVVEVAVRKNSVTLSLVVIALACAPAEPEPTYKGRPASEWIALARDKAVDVRMESIPALAAIGLDEDGTRAALVRLLDDEEFNIRQAAGKALLAAPEAVFGDFSVSQLLSLRETDCDPRGLCATDTPAQGLLIEELVRRKVVLAALLDEVGATGGSARDTVAKSAIFQMREKHAEESGLVAQLIEGLEHENSAAVSLCAEHLAALDLGEETPGAIEALERLLDDRRSFKIHPRAPGPTAVSDSARDAISKIRQRTATAG